MHDNHVSPCPPRGTPRLRPQPSPSSVARNLETGFMEPARPSSTEPLSAQRLEELYNKMAATKAPPEERGPPPGAAEFEMQPLPAEGAAPGGTEPVTDMRSVSSVDSFISCAADFPEGGRFSHSPPAGAAVPGRVSSNPGLEPTLENEHEGSQDAEVNAGAADGDFTFQDASINKFIDADTDEDEHLLDAAQRLRFAAATQPNHMEAPAGKRGNSALLDAQGNHVATELQPLQGDGPTA